jgi:hypothetical protein
MNFLKSSWKRKKKYILYHLVYRLLTLALNVVKEASRNIMEDQ